MVEWHGSGRVGSRCMWVGSGPGNWTGVQPWSNVHSVCVHICVHTVYIGVYAQNEYLGLVEQCMNFAYELMDLCRGTQEVEAVLICRAVLLLMMMMMMMMME